MAAETFPDPNTGPEGEPHPPDEDEGDDDAE